MNDFSQRRSSSAAPTSGGGQASQIATALAVFERVRSTVVEEMETIRRRKPIDCDSFSARKNMGLLDLDRLAPIIAKNLANVSLSRSLLDLKEALEASRAELTIELDAAKAMTELVASAMRHGESDGTYSSTTLFSRFDR